MLFPTQLFTTHVGQQGSKLSPRLWSRLMTQGVAPDGAAPGSFIMDDFLLFQGFTNAISGTTALPSTTVPGVDGYAIYADAATTASGVSRQSVAGGVARLAPGATDNHLVVLRSGPLGTISDTASAAKLTIFEARVALPTQVTAGSMFVGLATSTVCADGGLVVDTGELIAATGGGVGFRTLDADPDGIDVIYKKANQTTAVVKDVAQVATAGTFYNLGFVYDPMAPSSKRIRFFVDNEELTSTVTGTNIAAATFPDGDMLEFVIAAKTDATTARPVDIDCWAFYQAG